MIPLRMNRLAVISGIVLGWLSILGISLTVAFIFWVNWPFLVSGNGAGVYSVVFYTFALTISAVTWLASFWLYKNRLLTVLYWFVCLIPLPVFLFFPIWFQAPELSR